MLSHPVILLKCLGSEIKWTRRGIEVVELACAAPELLKSEFSDDIAKGIDSYTLRQPLGVVTGITPINFPMMVPMWMFPVALVCGNTFVLKPSERDPSAPTFIAALLAEAGLPRGAFNVVHGDKVAVDALLDHPIVKAIHKISEIRITPLSTTSLSTNLTVNLQTTRVLLGLQGGAGTEIQCQSDAFPRYIRARY